jgi:hypothetical protein
VTISGKGSMYVALSPALLTAQEASSSLALLHLATGYWISQSLSVAATLGIADALKDGPRSIDELAAITQTHRPTLLRLMRALASIGVFTHSPNGCFALTPLAQPLQQGAPGSLRALLRQMGGAYRWQPWGELLSSVRMGDPAFARIFGSQVFDYYAHHPDAAALFQEAMNEIAALTAPAVAAAYDFSDVETVVDVGGGYGALLTAILQAQPHVQGVLFEAPTVTEEAARRLETAGVAARCSVAGGDFFESVPAGGDAYLLQFILHDWDDAHALIILRNCRRAMGPQSRLLLIETLIPPDDTPTLGKLMDLEMLVICGGREREESEYHALLAAAGFTYLRTIPTLAPLSILESR